MSNALAIASVTAVLKDLLNNGLVDHNVSSTVGNVTVTAVAPDRIDANNNNTQSQLNLFLYQVTPNAAWRNIGLPGRDARGERISNPPLALDLHYLLTAYGAVELHAEILLGYGMQLLHEVPVLSRSAIRTALAPPSLVAGLPSLPAGLQALYTSELAEQVEQIKIEPATLNTEEISRMWTAFQAHYRPTAAYQVSVVLIESKLSTRSPLPVRRPLVYVVPFKQPLIVQVTSQQNAGDPIVPGQPVVAGQRLVLMGRGLRAENVLVRIGGTDAPVADADISDTQIIVPIPGEVRAGLQSAQVSHLHKMGEPRVDHAGVDSNLAAFVLRPRLDAISIANVQGAGTNPRSADVTVQVAPMVAPTQRVVLLLNRCNAPSSPPASPLQELRSESYSFIAPSRFPLSPPLTPVAVTNTLTIPITGVPAGAYLARVQVDGADSPLAVGPTGHFVAPLVAIP